MDSDFYMMDLFSKIEDNLYEIPWIIIIIWIVMIVFGVFFLYKCYVLKKNRLSKEAKATFQLVEEFIGQDPSNDPSQHEQLRKDVLYLLHEKMLKFTNDDNQTHNMQIQKKEM